MNNSDRLQKMIEGAIKEISDGARIQRLKDIQIKEMEMEISKMLIENNYRHNITSLEDSSMMKSDFERNILETDIEGYKISLEFMREFIELKKIGILSDMDEFTDAAQVATINLLGRYNLYYPGICESKDGHIMYSDAEGIEYSYKQFLTQVYKLFDSKNITKFEKDRLLLAANYLYNVNKYMLNLKSKDNTKKRSRRVKTGILDTY